MTTTVSQTGFFSRNKNSQGKKWLQGKDEIQDREVMCSINK